MSGVRGWELFRDLPAAELRRVVSVARRRRFARNEVVFHRGDPATTLHLVARGRFAARVTTRLGDTTTYALHGPGDAFGELSLVDEDGVRSTTVIALEVGETFEVHRDDFQQLRDTYPVVDRVLVGLLAARLRSANERLLEALFVPADGRVLLSLARLADVYPGAETSVIPLTQEEIAGLAGVSRATVNRVLRAEVARGTVELRRGRTVVLDAQAVARRARTPLL